MYYVLFSMSHANLLDVLFCCWLIFACEQLQHLKEIMKPLMVSERKFLHLETNHTTFDIALELIVLFEQIHGGGINYSFGR